MSLLPLVKNSLKYGSADGGVTVHTDDETLNRAMEKSGKMIGLRDHVINGKTIYGPGDIEGHMGEDGKYYVIDFGRAMPPEAPLDIPSAIFYNLLHPTFVWKHKKKKSQGLCSDAFSSWLRGDKEEKKNLQGCCRCNCFLI
eukprot:TRINITY_DN3850_c0_g1_i1.p2 TRINITY_DN3850_c0_g1~~TRINITY_DN3850_c0_g1_i1.p2  ORF type:complete len:141 (+),score=27.91 TRINITY_DN3850_c0_g1_i1:744-1166(+)